MWGGTLLGGSRVLWTTSNFSQTSELLLALKFFVKYFKPKNVVGLTHWVSFSELGQLVLWIQPLMNVGKSNISIFFLLLVSTNSWEKLLDMWLFIIHHIQQHWAWSLLPIIYFPQQPSSQCCLWFEHKMELSVHCCREKQSKAPRIKISSYSYNSSFFLLNYIYSSGGKQIPELKVPAHSWCLFSGHLISSIWKHL